MISPRTGLWTDREPRTGGLKEPPLPFYLGVKPERRLSWWERRRQARLIKKWHRSGGYDRWIKGEL